MAVKVNGPGAGRRGAEHRVHCRSTRELRLLAKPYIAGFKLDIEGVKDGLEVLILVTKVMEAVWRLQEDNNGVEEKAIGTLYKLMLKWWWCVEGGGGIQVAPPSGSWIQNSEPPKKKCVYLHIMNIQVGVEIIKVDDATQRK